MIDKNRLKQECSRRGLTLTELAQRLEVDAAALKARLDGVADFTRGEIISIGQILELTQAGIDAIFFKKGLRKRKKRP